MRIMITGIRGFLGSALARSFLKEGDTVCGTSSRGPRSTSALPSDVTIVRLALGDTVSSRIFKEIDYVIHCAHDFSLGAFEQNVEGTRRIFEAARSSGVPLQAFVSSYSATPNAVTEYGKAKFELERFFEANSAIVLKPGLVLGAGGLGGRMLNVMRKSWIFPIPRGVRFPYVGLEDFVRTVKKIVATSQTGVYKIFYSNFTSFAEIAAAVKMDTGRPWFTITVPVNTIASGLSVAECLLDRLRIRLPVRSDSFKSLEANQAIPSGANCGLLPTPHTTLQEVVSTAVQKLDDALFVSS
jgi:Nucleoside-diphosphate-sugar epimerases